MGSPELRIVLMRAFMTHGRPRLTRLRSLLAQGDAQGVHFEAHGMKGMCSTVGALRCAELFAKIERFGKEGRLEPVAPLLDRADIEIGLVESMIGPRMKAA
jgi:HPt (histidine-containing phosphotransfer) domain-containing protein